MDQSRDRRQASFVYIRAGSDQTLETSPSKPRSHYLTTHSTHKSPKMSYLTTLLVVILCAMHAVSANDERVPIIPRLSQTRLGELRKQVEDCNANVCFAIDGSGSINATEFEAQQFFVQDLVSVLVNDENDVEVAAVQFGFRSSVISRLTADLEQFTLALFDAPQRGGGTALRKGIKACAWQLRRVRREPIKMVLLGDGRSSKPRAAARRANRFRRVGGEVFAVGTADADGEQLLKLAGGNADRVYEVDNFLDVLAIQVVIEDMVAEICGVGGGGE